MQRRGETAACAFHSRHTHRGTDIWHGLVPPPSASPSVTFFAMQRGGGRDCGMCLSFKAYTSRYGRFCTPCPKSTSQLIHHVFLLCKEAGQCGIYVSFKAYTSRYGRFACLVPNPPANSSIAFSCDAKKRGSAAYTFHLRHIHQGTDILHALTQIHQPTHPSRFLRCKEK